MQEEAIYFCEKKSCRGTLVYLSNFTTFPSREYSITHPFMLSGRDSTVRALSCSAVTSAGTWRVIMVIGRGGPTPVLRASLTATVDTGGIKTRSREEEEEEEEDGEEEIATAAILDFVKWAKWASGFFWDHFWGFYRSSFFSYSLPFYSFSPSIRQF